MISKMKSILILLCFAISIDGFLLSKKNDTSPKLPKKEKCMIVKGKGKHLVGDILYIHKEFLPTLKTIGNIVKQCNIKLSIRGSYEQLPDITKSTKFKTANVGKYLQFIIMDKTGKKLICNHICLAKEGEKIPEVKCLVTGLRKENLRYAPHGQAGALDDASDAKPGFIDLARRTQEICRDVKL